jgi:type IV pilus assembly protein PilF
LENPLYSTPEFAYTNAALCLIRIKETDRAKTYLRKALAANSNFPIALITSAGLFFEDQNFKSTKILMQHYHRVTKPTAKSLWLAIRADLDLGDTLNAEDLARRLQANFPLSDEYAAWLDLQ